MVTLRRDKYEKSFLTLARAVTVGVAYVSASPIPGLTSSFVAIFAALLPFDIVVASARPPANLKDWGKFFSVLWPRIKSTASTLLKGVVVGAAVGMAAIVGGLPKIIGAVFTSGLAYVWALGTRHIISTYVAILSGLALFERLTALEAAKTVRIFEEIIGAIAWSGGGTFAALIAGWGVGLVVGGITRLFLSRPYRLLRSSAYELPIEMRPFNEVLHVGEKSLVVSAKVEEGAPVAHLTLADSDLRETWRTSVLAIKRGDVEEVMPKGSAVLLPGDELILLTDTDQSDRMYDQFKAVQQDDEPRPEPAGH